MNLEFLLKEKLEKIGKDITYLYNEVRMIKDKQEEIEKEMERKTQRVNEELDSFRGAIEEYLKIEPTNKYEVPNRHSNPYRKIAKK